MSDLMVYCDGGARGNPGPAAIGFVIKDKKDKIYIKVSKFIGKSTNNIAEYTGVIKALESISKNKKKLPKDIKKINFYLDSMLVVNQLNGRFKVKNSNLQYQIIKVRGLENKIKASIFYHFIPREKNFIADQLVNQALDQQLKIG